MKASTAAFLLVALAFALTIAYAAKNNKIIPVGPQPTPSVSTSQGR